MKPEQKSRKLLAITRSKAKMYEYAVPTEHHILIVQDPAKLFTISIAMLGDLAAAINRKATPPEDIATLRENLLFSAHFFDAYLLSKLNETLDPYLLLIGSASYYLSDLPGSAMVLAKRMGEDCPYLEGAGLESLLLWLLQGDVSTYFEASDGLFGKQICEISKSFLRFYNDGSGVEHLDELSKQLRATIYASGTPRQLLLGDVIVAVIETKLQNSSWKALPLYSGLSEEKWRQALQKTSFIKELWPAQHLLGQAGVLRGESAVIQMPTSAGKTKAVELIIRSSYLAGRTSLAVIIAPFRALCHEIKDSLVSAFQNEHIEVDELSDALQADFEISELIGHKQILVVTPEKLLYVLRHDSELATNIGLIIFDEGHQFDNGIRGITYELLLTSLRSILPEGTQKVLISAVISNAAAVGEWLNGTPKVVSGCNLIPTYRSLGFASWLSALGSIEYVSSSNLEKSEFYVPRVIESFPLQRNKGESKTKVRMFPDKYKQSDVGKEIALYLGIKLMREGAVAIFCGRKDTASGLCETIADRFSRNLPMEKPSEYSNSDELIRLTHLIENNLGISSPAARSAHIGVFPHHGNTPHGIRLAVEHSMRAGLIRFVICTSTLAQGVNLPIRYLIVTSVYQGLERIKNRDFHNLIGRAGRAGMHTEGSVLFADPIVYDKRNLQSDNWRWNQVKDLVDPSNSEPCISNLLSIFDPITSDDEKYNVQMEALDFARAYINDPDEFAKITVDIALNHGDEGFSKEGIERQVLYKIQLISSIESFLLSRWDEAENTLSLSQVTSLAEETLGYFLADEKRKTEIRALFELLANNILVNITDPNRRMIFGRTLYGVKDALAIERWFHRNIDKILASENEHDLLTAVWPLLTAYIYNGMFKKCDNKEVLREITQSWIEGKSFHYLLTAMHQKEAKMIWGTKLREFKIDHVVDIFEGGLAYDGTLLIGSLIEMFGLNYSQEMDDHISRMELFQKQLKYGLPTRASIALYEIGFCDRGIAQELASILRCDDEERDEVLTVLKNKQTIVESVVNKYPEYFRNQFFRLVANE